MSSRLTWNGLSPGIIGALTERDKHSLVTFAAADINGTYTEWHNRPDLPVSAFAHTVDHITDSYLAWGAKLAGSQKIRLVSSYLKEGETTFMSDIGLHSDWLYATEMLQDKNLICLRFLSAIGVGSQAEFIDLTKQEKMAHILDQFRIDKGRFYEPQLLDLARKNDDVVQPVSGDIILFDETTPHQPPKVLEPQRRIVQSARIELLLPPDWRVRIKSGDAPKL